MQYFLFFTIKVFDASEKSEVTHRFCNFGLSLSDSLTCNSAAVLASLTLDREALEAA